MKNCKVFFLSVLIIISLILILRGRNVVYADSITPSSTVFSGVSCDNLASSLLNNNLVIESGANGVSGSDFSINVGGFKTTFNYISPSQEQNYSSYGLSVGLNINDSFNTGNCITSFPVDNSYGFHRMPQNVYYTYSYDSSSSGNFAHFFVYLLYLPDNTPLYTGLGCYTLEYNIYSDLSNPTHLLSGGQIADNGSTVNIKNISMSSGSKYYEISTFNVYTEALSGVPDTYSACNNLGLSGSDSPPSVIYYSYSVKNTPGFLGLKGFGTDLYTFYLYSPVPPQGVSYNYKQACGQGSSAVGTTSYNNCIPCIQQNSAQDQSNGVYEYVYTDFGCVDTSTPGIIRFIYQLMVIVGAIISFISMLVGGYMFMTSGGDPDKVQKAKTVLTNAIIGLLVIIFAVVILGTIGTIFGISVISF